MPAKIELDTNKAMIEIAEHIETYTEGKYGFMVLVFAIESTNGGRAAHYISNCNREDMIKALREKANALEEVHGTRSLYVTPFFKCNCFFSQCFYHIFTITV
jgi:hypothetical protein